MRRSGPRGARSEPRHSRRRASRCSPPRPRPSRQPRGQSRSSTCSRRIPAESPARDGGLSRSSQDARPLPPGHPWPHHGWVRSSRLRLAIGIAVLDTVLLLAAIVLETREHIHAGPSPHWLAFVELVIVLGYAPLAVLVVSRQPRNPVPWFLLYFATTAGLQIVLAYIAQRMLAEGVDGAEWLAWLTDWMVSPAFATLYVLLLQLFPDGRPASPRFRPLVYWTVAVIVLGAVLQALIEGDLQSYDIENPAGFLPAWTQGPAVAGVRGHLRALAALAGRALPRVERTREVAAAVLAARRAVRGCALPGRARGLRVLELLRRRALQCELGRGAVPAGGGRLRDRSPPPLRHRSRAQPRAHLRAADRDHRRRVCRARARRRRACERKRHLSGSRRRRALRACVRPAPRLVAARRQPPALRLAS